MKAEKKLKATQATEALIRRQVSERVTFDAYAAYCRTVTDLWASGEEAVNDFVDVVSALLEVGVQPDRLSSPDTRPPAARVEYRIEGTELAIEVGSRLRARVLVAIVRERARQLAKWGVQNIPIVPEDASVELFERLETMDRERCEALAAKGEVTFSDIIVEELAELRTAAARGDADAIRLEAIQVAAVALQIVEHVFGDSD